MPTILQRKLKCKYTGSDDYLPPDVPREKFMPVVGFEYRKRKISGVGENHNTTKEIEDLYFLVINSKGKITTIASFNCNTMIDENAEINAGSLMQLLNNITIMGKVLSEKVAKGNQNKIVEGDAKQGSE